MNTTNKKFTCPVSMVCTQEQANELYKELEKLGYTPNTSVRSNSNLLVYTNTAGTSDKYSSIEATSSKGFKDSNNRYFIDHYNKDLFLALAAMHEGTDHEQKLVGEYLKYNNNIFRVNSITDFENSYSKGTTNGHCVSYTKATKEEIIQHFKQNTNMKYILLKDTPDFKAGEVFEKRTPKARNYTALSNNKTLPCSTVEDNTEWFEIQEDFKAGDHVVVTDFGSLSSMAGPEFLLETVYVLAENFDEENGFIVELDNSGNTDNGWSAGFSKIKLRKATSAEIVKYNKANAEEKAIRVKLGKSGYTSTIEEDKGEYQIAFGCKKLKVHQLEAIKTIMELFDNEFRTGDNISLRINNERITLLPDDNDESIEDLEYVEWKGDDVSSESIDKFIQILKAKNKK